MTPGQARDTYKRMIAALGETVTFRRIGTPNVDKDIRCRVTGYQPDQVVGAIQQGDRRLVALAEDVEGSGFPTPIRERFDKVILRGHETTIQAVDDSTRRVAGTLIAYELRIRG